ncbi:hypothetical protein VTK73DRAFT_4624 [Phialemonium thermophilum]|uniref:Uncharacterized protein n=1 Tax=Phialemonium thermophilum TaxID=223376 RepID=A0ABR3V7G2_9PEZI
MVVNLGRRTLMDNGASNPARQVLGPDTWTGRTRCWLETGCRPVRKFAATAARSRSSSAHHECDAFLRFLPTLLLTFLVESTIVKYSIDLVWMQCRMDDKSPKVGGLLIRNTHVSDTRLRYRLIRSIFSWTIRYKG